MHRRFSKHLLTFAALIGLAVLGAAPTARAAFMISVFENGLLAGQFTDEGPGDLLIGEPGELGVQVSGIGGLNDSLLYYQFNSLSGTSTGSAIGTDPSGTASLTMAFEVFRNTTVFAGVEEPTLEIVVTDNNFIVPTGTPKVMFSSASNTFTNSPAGNRRTFQSVFSGDNEMNEPVNGDEAIASPLQTTVSTGTTTNPGQPVLDTTTTPLGDQDNPFGLTNYTLIQLTRSPNLTTGKNVLGGSGSTQVQAVIPEPGSIVLGLVGGLPLLGLAWLRRRKANV